MLLLLFEIGEGRYALTSTEVVEIVHLVRLRRIPRTPDYVAGMMNLRGQPVPVIDLCRLVEARPCARRLSTRIIVVDHGAGPQGGYRLGLIAERVTEATRTDQVRLRAGGVLMEEELRMGGGGEGEMVQWFDLDRVLPADTIQLLFPG
ncbi:MAG: chemotaxis protein CheW [Thermodesulfobacteriota bacterium]